MCSPDFWLLLLPYDARRTGFFTGLLARPRSSSSSMVAGIWNMFSTYPSTFPPKWGGYEHLFLPIHAHSRRWLVRCRSDVRDCPVVSGLPAARSAAFIFE